MCPVIVACGAKPNASTKTSSSWSAGATRKEAGPISVRYCSVNYDEAGRLLYAGRAGSGISDAELERLWPRLQPLAAARRAAAADQPFRPAAGALSRALGAARVGGPGQISHLDRARDAAASRLSGHPRGQAGERGAAPVRLLSGVVGSERRKRAFLI